MNLNSKIIILSTQISPIGYSEIVEFYVDCIQNKKKGTINYANIHTINIVDKNEDKTTILNSFDITHPDGIGIWLISKIFNLSPKFDRFNWTDHALSFLQTCQDYNWKIFFLGSSAETIRKAFELSKLSFPNLQISGFHDGYSDIDSPDLIKLINKDSPEIIWVGMGVPKQEEWIHKYKESLDCKVFHAVGDVFSELAGRKQRGPQIIRKLGLEWLIRAVTNPRNYFNRYLLYDLPFFLYLSIQIMKKKIKRSD